MTGRRRGRKVVFIFLFLLFPINVHGMESENESYIQGILEQSGISLQDVEEQLEDSSIGGKVNFIDMIKKLWKGDTEEIFDELGTFLKDSLFSELLENRNNFFEIILLAVFAAMFSNLAAGMFSSSIQNTGFFVAYLAMTGIVLQSFFLMLTITKEALAEVFGFMESFLPAFAIAITVTSGSASSIAVYELTFLLIQVGQWVLKMVVLPLIEAYVMIGIINGVGEKETFSNMGNLIQQGAEQILKWGTGVILSLNMIQNMILPAVDSVKSTLWQRGISAIPGAGGIFSTLTGGVLGASVLIKNSIGVGCLLILMLFLAIPVVKLFVFTLSFSVCGALLQPISDKRFLGLLHVTGKSGKMLLQTVVTCLVLFFITIALAVVSTNARYYVG